MSNKIHESVTRFKLYDFTVRVWREESDNWDKMDNTDLSELLEDELHHCHDAKRIAMRVSELPRVSAVEVMDGSGTGILMYPDWP